MALVLLILLAEPPLPSGVPAPVKGPNPYLSQAKELYEKLDFEKCLKRLAQAPQWKSDAAELIEIELVAGMCHYNLNQRADAEERFRLALRMNGDAELPPYTSPKLVDFFLSVKRKLRAPPPPLPEKDLDLPKDDPPPDIIEAPPPDEPRVEPKPPPKKLTPEPKPPPEVPEVQQPSAVRIRPAPIVLGAAAVVALAVAIGLGANSRSLEAQARVAYFESDFYALGDAARTNATGANVLFGLGGAAALGAVISWLVTMGED